MIEDVDDFLNTTPREKFFEIIFNANKNLVKESLEDLVKKCAFLENMLEKHNIEESFHEYLITNSEDMVEKENDLYIQIVSDILTQHE